MINEGRRGASVRFLSPNIWDEIPIGYWNVGRGGTYFFDDFHTLPGHWTTSLGTGVTATLADTVVFGTGVTAARGELVLTHDGTANDQAAILLGDDSGGSFKIDKSNGRKLAFEARVRKSTVAATSIGVFVGLVSQADYAAGFLANSTGALVATADCIGFHMAVGTSAAILNAVYQKGSQTPQTVKATAHTMVADEYVNLGFLFDPTNSDASKQIKFFVNNVDVGSYVTQTNLDAATFPDGVVMMPAVFSHVGAGATAGTVKIDAIAVAQSE